MIIAQAKCEQALVHFAVSNHEVEMMTKLEGPATRFLPFNRGNDGGKGNPPNPAGHPTSYLWEEVWARDGWLEKSYAICKADMLIKGQDVTNIILGNTLYAT